MTKKDLIKELTENTYLTHENAAQVVDTIVDIFTEKLCQGESIYLRGLGMLKVVEMPARECKKPLTGETISVPARKHLRFEASEAIKARINS